MYKRKLKYFFATLIISLLIILPTFILIGAYSVSNVLSVGETVQDVPLVRSTAEDEKNILLIKSGDNPSFILLRFDAFDAKVVSLTFKNDLLVEAQNNAHELLEQGGPAMVTTELETLLDIDIDYFCMLDESQMMTLTRGFKAATPSPSISERFSALAGQSISPSEIAKLVKENPEDELLRTVCYSLMLEANMGIMGTEIPTAMQELDGKINTNLDAEGLQRLTKIFNLLPYEKVNYYAATLSGEDTQSGMVINSSDLDKAQELMG